jgi:transcriptional regulator with XRE-family HTH domain
MSKRISAKSDKDKSLVALGGAIRALRQEIGMSQEDLALRSGIDRSHMGRIERGERNVTILNLVRIAKALQRRVADFFLVADL